MPAIEFWNDAEQEEFPFLLKESNCAASAAFTGTRGCSFPDGTDRLEETRYPARRMLAVMIRRGSFFMVMLRDSYE